ncbi:MAG: hypothetical protein KTM48_01815 [Wolbachia endosymbiont of Pissodes strobi]|nr:hypothetical protein [Wolbachia endosymbiont of Pissodes strobi]
MLPLSKLGQRPLLGVFNAFSEAETPQRLVSPVAVKKKKKKMKKKKKKEKMALAVENL